MSCTGILSFFQSSEAHCQWHRRTLTVREEALLLAGCRLQGVLLTLWLIQTGPAWGPGSKMRSRSLISSMRSPDREEQGVQERKGNTVRRDFSHGDNHIFLPRDVPRRSTAAPQGRLVSCVWGGEARRRTKVTLHGIFIRLTRDYHASRAGGERTSFPGASANSANQKSVFGGNPNKTACPNIFSSEHLVPTSATRFTGQITEIANVILS